MMNDIVEGLCLILAACAVACCFGYFKGWCCDGGRIKSEFQNTRSRMERKIRKQIRKMVAAEKEIKRLAVIATSGTDEDPNEYVSKIRNLLYPLPNTAGETDHLGRPNGVTITTDGVTSWPMLSASDLFENGNEESMNIRVALNPTSDAMELDNFHDNNYMMENESQLMNSNVIDLQDYDSPPYTYANTTISTSESYNYGNHEEMPPSYEECMRGVQYV